MLKIFKAKIILASLIIATISWSEASNQSPNLNVSEKLKNLENSINFQGKIGVYAIDTNSQQIISYRGDQYFPVQSTMKLIAVAALLKQSENDKINKNLLLKKINYSKKDLITWHPVTGKYINLKNGMTLENLAEAAISYSDNTAVNLIIKYLGGPTVITNFANKILNNQSFNIEHYDGYLNSDPKDHQDSATPRDMAISVKKLLLNNNINNILILNNKIKLFTWMRNNTTSYKRMRSGVPIGWVVADKTGSGDFGIANDIGLVYSPLCRPIVLAIYTVQNQKNSKSQDSIIAATTNIILSQFAKNKNDHCFQQLLA